MNEVINLKYNGDHAEDQLDEYDDLLFSERTLSFFRSKLNDFAIDIFLLIAVTNKENKGFIKTRIDDYRDRRFFIDSALTVLEAQGFIKRGKVGTMAPYYLTNRGKQLLGLVIRERKNMSERKE